MKIKNILLKKLKKKNKNKTQVSSLNSDKKKVLCKKKNPDKALKK